MKKTECRHCNSNKIIKYGNRINKRKGKTQIYKCKECCRKFTLNEGFLYTEHKGEIIIVALDLYAKNVSLRGVQDHIKQIYGTDISHVTVLRWIRKYGRMMNDYVSKLKPKSSGIWNVDETTMYFKGNHNWLWDVIDKETRFILATHLSMNRWSLHAKRTFEKAKELCEEDPIKIISDGHASYPSPIKDLFANTEHVRLKSFEDKFNNNTIERFWSTIKTRTKVMRGFRSYSSARQILLYWILYYNFVRDHMSIGMTPAKASGIDLGLKENRWGSLIKKSVS